MFIIRGRALEAMTIMSLTGSPQVVSDAKFSPEICYSTVIDGAVSTLCIRDSSI